MRNQTLESYIDKRNWPSDFLEAKDFARQALKVWEHKKKYPEFLERVEEATTVKRLQQIVCYTFLSGENMGVIYF